MSGSSYPVGGITGLFNELLDPLDVLRHVIDGGELGGEVLNLSYLILQGRNGLQQILH